MNMQTMTAVRPDFRELVLAFAKIGLLSFGGPAGQIALMHRLLVEEKKWISEERYLHALNFCMLLPGPEAQQLATYTGWLLHGVRGGVVAGLLFIVPGAIVMLGLSAIYIFLGQVPLVDGLLFGLKAAVLAVVLEALIKVGRRSLTSFPAVLIAIVAFFAIAVMKLPFPVIIGLAAAAGFLIHRTKISSVANAPTTFSGGAERKEAVLSTLVWLSLWLMPLLALWWGFGRGYIFADQAVFFSKMAVVTFGGAYAVLAYVAQQAVELYGWLSADDMLAGLGLAETTPGPLILVLVFVGFVGGSRLSTFDPMIGGLLGWLTALWFTFVPSFLWIFAGAPFVERLRHIGWLAASLAAITAAVVGVIANLAVWFGLQVLFGQFETAQWGWLHWPILNFSALDFPALIIAVAAGIALIGMRWNLLFVLGWAAFAGAALRLWIQ